MQNMTMTAAGNGHIIADWASMPEWITIDEAADLSHYNPDYLRRLARKGRLGAAKKGRDWWIDRDALQAYMEAPPPRGRPVVTEEA